MTDAISFDAAVAVFAQQRNADALDRALQSIESRLDLPEAPQRLMRFFATLDAALDPKWDAAKPPPQGVPVPPSHRGVVRMTGAVDPADIADEAERARYVADQQANNAARRAYDLQGRLRPLEERARSVFVQLSALRPAEMRSLMQGAVLLSEDRLRELRGLLTAR